MTASLSEPVVCDVAIVGGGLVGASLALALAKLPLTVMVIEALPPEDPKQPSFDAKTTALSNGTARILTGLGVWDDIARDATPIRQIHVSDRGHFGSALIDAKEQGLSALGYVAENRRIGAALWRRLSGASRLQVRSPATVAEVATLSEHVMLTVQQAEGVTQVGARLVVAADGAQSLVRQASGVAATRVDYQQTAVIAKVLPERWQDAIAYERFTADGPIAILPAPEGRVVVVWTMAPAEAARVVALADADFLTELQSAFGWRLGRFVSVADRQCYPLALTQSAASSAPRVAMIGNAAQGLHPIAGQGFNLGLRDAATLAEVLADACGVAGSAPVDVGSEAVLSRFAEWRERDRRLLIGFTDGLVRVFASPFAPIRALRGLGLVLFDLSPTAKSALSKLSAGFAGRLPRLLRGLALTRDTNDRVSAP
jgi:2-octaprenyl-6-methoxyphenol hydroxylase